MKIQTFSILAGSSACNARCPFCISHMTPAHGVPLKEPEVNWHNFQKGCHLAKASGVTTVMLTSKGEPTLFPDMITKMLEALEPFNFPLIELQTNGIPIMERPERYAPLLKRWYDLGLTTVAVSIVDTDPESNRQIYLPHKREYIDLPGLIDVLHTHKLSVRLSVTMLRDFIDSPEGVERLLAYAREHKVEQLSVRPVNKPTESEDRDAALWTAERMLNQGLVDRIRHYLIANGTLLMTLIHGAQVFDVKGQNICLTDCLTLKGETEDIRQLIFFPDGTLGYDWAHTGARFN